MRAALGFLLVPALAAAAPPFSTSIAVEESDEAFTSAVRMVRAKLDACWKTEQRVKLQLTVDGGAVKDVVLVEVDPKAPLPCLTKALRAIKAPGTQGVFTVVLAGEPEHLLLTKSNIRVLSQITTLNSNSIGLGTGTSFGKVGTASGPVPKVAVGPGDTTSAEIDRVIRARAGVFRACYQKELNRTPKLAGKVVMKFRIEDTGSVLKATVHTTTLKSDAVEKCLVANVMRLRFPASTGPAEITYPFVFSQGG